MSRVVRECDAGKKHCKDFIKFLSFQKSSSLLFLLFSVISYKTFVMKWALVLISRSSQKLKGGGEQAWGEMGLTSQLVFDSDNNNLSRRRRRIQIEHLLERKENSGLRSGSEAIKSPL